MKQIMLLLLFSCFIGPWLGAQARLTISGGHVNVAGNTSLVLHNTQWVNNGNFNAGTGTVVITGAGVDTVSAIGGDSTTTFYNLEMNKSSNGSQLRQAIQVDNELRMTNGNLDLNNHVLTLESANGTIIGEQESSRVLGPNGGYISKTVIANAPTNLNPGNIGVRLTSAANIGSLTVRRGHVPQVIDEGSTQIKGFARYFDFTAANNAALDLSAQVQYFDGELSNGDGGGDVGFWRRDSSFWFNPVKTSADNMSNTVDVDNIDLLSRWTLANEGIKVMPKILLEGNYSTVNGLMTDDLRTNNLIPTRSPYTNANYDTGNADGTESINPAVLVNNSNDAIVDWVFVEFRNDFNNDVFFGRSALLQRDGDVVDLDGKSPVAVAGFTSGIGTYIAVRHRNHLGVRTLNSISSSPTPASVDFTTSNGVALGGANALAQMSDGKFALFAGDFNADGQIQLAGDRTNILPFLGQSGYLNGDLDLNGQVQNAEVQAILTPNLGRGAQFTY
ncbi:MAG: hypothetical protein AAFU03_11730 [Bacteroidota bacterium]